jgi:excisionase family DNA binding protein
MPGMNAPTTETAAATLADGRLFLSAAEVGLQLGLKRSRVYELAAAGLLPVVRLGRRMLFPRRGLEALADAAVARVRAELLEADINARHHRRVA